MVRGGVKYRYIALIRAPALRGLCLYRTIVQITDANDVPMPATVRRYIAPPLWLMRLVMPDLYRLMKIFNEVRLGDWI